MAKPVYKMFMGHYTEAWYQLSADARQSLLQRLDEAGKSAGAKGIIECDSSWASERWTVFGVEEFPDIEAVQKHSALLNELQWFRYFETFTTLGTAFPQYAAPADGS
jgi:hypothetical protein